MAMTVTLDRDVRRWLANKLAGLARRIYPQSEEVMAFWTDRMMDMFLTGQSTIKVQAIDQATLQECMLKTTNNTTEQFTGDKR